MTTPPAAAVDAAHAPGIDCRDLPADLTICPYGLAHAKGSAACGEFRRAAVAKGFRPPRGGWACQPAPARGTTVDDRTATEEDSSVAGSVGRSR